VSEKRYLILAEGKALDPHYGKTARGVILYGRHAVAAVVDSQNAGAEVEGVPIVASVGEGLALDPKPNTALVGVAVAGGRLPPEWRSVLFAVLEAVLDLESGMHEFLSDDPDLAKLARRHGAEIRDLRKPPGDLSVSTGENLRHEATAPIARSGRSRWRSSSTAPLGGAGSARCSFRRARPGSRSQAGGSR
jgi:uncharacterized NAD-dependent epimerase/dehydratase family protein